jgi:hypothetical protein
MSEHWIDRAWKDVINENADDAISFFLPKLAAERDYSKEPESADPVHEPIGGDSDKGSRISDICLSVPLLTGIAPRALFLAEQQHEKDDTLPGRLFQSYYRASDEFRIPVTALARFTGKEKPVGNYFRSYHGTEVNFKYNIYSVMEANGEELKEDKRIFALPVLAAKRMLEAGGHAEKRGKYSLELLDLTEARKLGSEKTWSLKRFVYRILQVGKDDIDPKVREAWKMQFRPISEVVRDIHLRDAREEGMEAGMEKGMEKGREKGKFEVARSMLADGFPAETVRKYTGLDESSILSLR